MNWVKRCALLLVLAVASFVLVGWTFIVTNFFGLALDPVTFGAPANNDVPIFNSATGTWKTGSSSATVSDASATVKGITKLSVAPVSAANPIAVGDNDARMNPAPSAAGNMVFDTGAAYQTIAAGANGTLLLGQGAGSPLFKTLTSDATISPNGGITIANGVVSYAKMQAETAVSLLGNDTNAQSATRAIVGTADQLMSVNHAGTALAFVTVSGDLTNNNGALTIAANAVTLGDMATLAAHSVIGNTGSSAATPTAVSIGANQFLIGASGGTTFAATTLSGDVTNVAGAVTIGANKVTLGDLATLVGLSLIGNTGTAIATPVAVTGTANQIPIVNNAGTALAFTSLSGDVTNATGAMTIAANAVTFAKHATQAALTLVGNGTNATAVPSALAGTANQIPIVNNAGTALAFTSLSGDVTNATGAMTIAANAVTFAKHATQAALTLVGNGTNATAVPSALAGTANQIPIVNNAGTALAFATVSGDLTNATGVFTIGANKVTLGDLATLTGLSLIGNTGSSTATPVAVTGTANQIVSVNAAGTALAFVTVSGDITNANGVLTIGAGAVTLADQANLAARSVIGNTTNSAAVPAAVAIGANQFLIGNSGGTAFSALTLSGDVTNVAGAVTIGANKVTLGDLATLTGLSLIGSSGSSTATPVAITGTANQIVSVNAAGSALAFVTVSGDITNTNGVLTIGAGKVTLADMANLAASTLVGRDSTGTGVPEALTLGSGISISAGGVISVTGGPPTGTAGGDLAGTYPNPTVAQASQSFALSGVLSPSALSSGVNNDYSPTNLATSDTVRVTTTASQTAQITGLAGGAAGRIITLTNVSANNVGLYDSNTGSSAANRFLLGQTNPVTLSADQSVFLQYDSTSSRWRLIDSPQIRTITVTPFTSSGTYTPRAGLVYAVIECVGGGGGGGGAAASTGQGFAAAGGGAGGYSRVTVTAAQVGTSQTVTIGTKGSGGATGNNPGTAGVATSVGTLCVANGGAGGVAGGNAAPGTLGGTAGTGDIAATGAPGGGGFLVTVATVVAAAGNGGSSPFGAGGPGSAALGGVANGTAGTGNGSGGGGGTSQNSASTAAGGDGTAGFALVTEYSTR